MQLPSSVVVECTVRASDTRNLFKFDVLIAKSEQTTAKGNVFATFGFYDLSAVPKTERHETHEVHAFDLEVEELRQRLTKLNEQATEVFIRATGTFWLVGGFVSSDDD